MQATFLLLYYGLGPQGLVRCQSEVVKRLETLLICRTLGALHRNPNPDIFRGKEKLQKNETSLNYKPRHEFDSS